MTEGTGILPCSMTTEVLQLVDQGVLEPEIARAGEILRGGGLVAFPTETVYGIAVAADIPEAVERLYALKGRPRDKAMTMMVADPTPVRKLCGPVSPTVARLIQRFWPGPLTLVLPALEGGLAGFRLPSHPLARRLVEAARVPLLVPSANKSGEPPATTAAEVLAAFPTELDLIIDGGTADGGVSSTVAKVEGDTITVLREGAIPEARLRSSRWSHVLFVCQGNTDRSPLAGAIVRRSLAKRLGCGEHELEGRGFVISSAGLAAEPGAPAGRKARAIAREAFDPPLNLEGHRSQKLTHELVESASRIFCMERAHRDQILAFFPHRERDVLLLDPENNDIADPVGKPISEFRRLASRLNAAATLIVGSLTR